MEEKRIRINGEDTNYIVREDMSISAAARAIGMVEGSLRYALNKGKECGGYFWKKKIS